MRIDWGASAERIRSNADSFLIVCALAVVAIVVCWSLIAGPALDDFCFANMKTGAVSTMTGMYHEWSGRWLTFLLIGAIFPGSHFAPYWPLLLIGLAMWWATFAILVRDIRLGTVLFGLFVAIMPNLGEGLFWATNVIAYTLPILLATIALRSPWYAAAPAAILAAGGSEFVGAFLLCLLVLKRDWRIAVACIVGLAINVAAPGNFVRADHYQQASIVLAFLHTFANYDSIVSLAFDPRIALLALMLLARPRDAEERWAAPAAVAISAAAAFAIILLIHGPPPGRLLDLFAAAILAGAAQTARSVPWRIRVDPALFAIPLGLSILVSPNVGAMVREVPDALRGQATSVLPKPYLPDNFSQDCYRKWKAEGH